MRLMYDAVTPSNVPQNAQMVAGYIDGNYQSYAGLVALFPNAVHVPIAVHASTNNGVVLDVETGDATPDQAPGWVTMRRSAGVDPTVYCSLSVWSAVRGAFINQGVAEPHYWIAAYPGIGSALYDGAVAHQYQDYNNLYDLSVVADYWPGVDGSAPVPGPAPTPHPKYSKGDDMFLVSSDDATPRFWVFMADHSHELTAAQYFAMAVSGAVHMDKVPALGVLAIVRDLCPAQWLALQALKP